MNQNKHRLALGIEYDGTAFHGWQRQRDVVSVQETLEKALSKVAAESIKVVAAGRTDTGVHATQQVIHFDTTAERHKDAWIMGTNTFLPPQVRVLWVKPVPSSFDARRSALSRRYLYKIYSHRIRPSLYRNQVGWCFKKLDLQKMREASEFLIGEHDFSSFRASECQSKTPVRRMMEINITSLASSHPVINSDSPWINIEFEANAFLHHMVRNMVGVLWKIGAGEAAPEWVKEVLLAKDRKTASITAPPQGLYLIAVRYPECYEIP